MVVKNQLDNQLITISKDDVRLANLNEWDIPVSKELQPSPIRNCRYVRPQLTSSSELTEAVRNNNKPKSRGKRLLSRTQRDRLSSRSEFSRNEVSHSEVSRGEVSHRDISHNETSHNSNNSEDNLT